MPRRALFTSLALALVTVLAFGSVALAKADHRRVSLIDNCDAASFNAALGPGACVRRGGGTTFERLIANLIATGTDHSWRFSPGDVKLAAGGSIAAVNTGGDIHTFTEVEAFGGGCVDEINALLGLTPVPECAEFGPAIFGLTGVDPGATRETAPLPAGTHLFMCVIHPWQQTTVVAS
jgi:hypothetical protein